MSTSTKKRPYLTGSQDLLKYFNLIPIYNKVVKPYPPPNRASELDPTLYSYISDLPGKMDMEPDGYLLNLLRDPQAVETGSDIRPLDADTLKDAFTLREGPIPGFDASILGNEDGDYNTPNSGQYLGGDYHSATAGELDYNGERKHKKKKKKRRHGHEHDEDGHSHGDHKKKKKKKKDKERRDEYNEFGGNESLIID
ncbi:uncharacterized protein BX663DRAFT_514613 [Cokeromyces recurvatus]|uniref:uncharacterized protein n=1 Tax=Cokeromyces recurvatus TaxID=90255 RepID=UPI0022201514|nr:uncharacterized protein BX663DRAFT_514613 [Cokeromyces recurvatus]KAI7901492.1 hypothetical protein BX663DRAFT_514613 [Cokeromyces recurvatus]